MKVNFNNLRKQLVYKYDKLCDNLNHAIQTKRKEREWLEDYGWIDDETIVIDANEIQDTMDELRSLIGSIAMVYEENDENFKDVYSQIFPEDSEKRMKEFNPEKEQLNII